MKRSLVLPLLAALLVGGALGYVAALLTDRPTVSVVSSRQESAKARAIAGVDDAEVQSLRARIRELEKRLAEGDRISASDEAAVETAEAKEPQHESFRDRLARLEKEDPVRFAQMTNRMAQGRQRHVARQQAKLDFLASIDTSRLGEKARQVHEDLQDAIVARDALEQKLFDPDLTDDQRHQLMKEMHELNKTTNQLNTRERNNLMAATAKALGIKGEKTKEFMSTMKDILEATERSGGPGGGPGGGPPPGPPPGK